MATNLAAFFELETGLDDSNLEEPTGIEPKPWRSIGRTIEVENIGDQPLEGVRLVVNGRDLTHTRGLLDLARAGTLDRIDTLALFRAWTDLRVQGESGTPENASPIHAVACFGHTSAKSDSVALFRLLSALGVPVRFALLNRHEAIEAEVHGRHVLLDGDRELFYTRLDGQLASLADLVADPFLAIRSKPFGRAYRYDLKRSWDASRVFDPVVTSTAPMLSGRQELPGLQDGFTLFPGEKLRFDLEHPPPHAAGTEPIGDDIRQAALRRIELEVDAGERSRVMDPVTVSSPYPVLELRTGNDSSPITRSPFVRSVVLEPGSGRTTLMLQSSQVAMPRLKRGKNLVLVESMSVGIVKVSVSYGPIDRQPPIVTLEVEKSPGPVLVPGTIEQVQRIHWQVGTDPSFARVDSIFDVVEPYVGPVALTPIERTHLLPGQAYFARVRIAVKDRWSSFSNVVPFSDTKPATPTVRAVAFQGDRVSFELAPQKGVTFHVFGSDRRDFVPKPYSSEEVIEVDGPEAASTATVTHVLASFEGPEALVPARRFYRVIAELDGSLSVPTSLIDSGASRPAKVLEK